MIEQAIKYAKRSTIMRHKTGAVIVDRQGKFVSAGWSHRTHVNLATTPFSMHAELHAILRAPTKDSLRGATIYVATLNANCTAVTDSCPCSSCGGVIKEAGITEVIYTKRVKVASK